MEIGIERECEWNEIGITISFPCLVRNGDSKFEVAIVKSGVTIVNFGVATVNR